MLGDITVMSQANKEFKGPAGTAPGWLRTLGAPERMVRKDERTLFYTLL